MAIVFAMVATLALLAVLSAAADDLLEDAVTVLVDRGCDVGAVWANLDLGGVPVKRDALRHVIAASLSRGPLEGVRLDDIAALGLSQFDVATVGARDAKRVEIPRRTVQRRGELVRTRIVRKLDSPAALEGGGLGASGLHQEERVGILERVIIHIRGTDAVVFLVIGKDNVQRRSRIHPITIPESHQVTLTLCNLRYVPSSIFTFTLCMSAIFALYASIVKSRIRLGSQKRNLIFYRSIKILPI